MTVPNLIPAEGTTISVRPSVAYSPYTPNWWMQSYIERIPETSVGWMVAQGWQVVSTYVEESCGQTFYRMSRQSMNSWMILQACLNTYVQKYNEANAANVIRYENILTLWNETIHKSRDQMDVQGDVSDGHMAVFITQMDDIVTTIQDEMAEAKADATAAGAIVTAQLADYLVLLNTLEGIYNTHESDAEALLTNLGVARAAEINEKYDNLLSVVKQNLVNRGLYSSSLLTQMQLKVEKDRTDELTKLAEDLAREKLANEHTLYQQEMAVKGMVLDGKMKNTSMQHAQGQYLVEVKTKCALTIMQARLNRCQSRMDIRDREDKLMAYQLDTRNNLIIGLFGVMERRTDSGPQLEDMTRLITGLGDAGGGWVTP